MNNSFSYSESLRFERLSGIFSDNFRITELYAAYLERLPDLITARMVELVCEGTELGPEDVIPALLAEAFGLDPEREEDKRLIYGYIARSVRILDTEKYTNNPYYKNIKLADTVHGDWEIKLETYPAYRAFIAGDMLIADDMSEVPPLGYFKEPFTFPAVLEDGNEWMTLTPVDLDTCDDAIAAAHGKVITFGLGLGYYAYMVSEKPEVSSITVVEKSPSVIELFRRVILPQFPSAHKVRIIEADAFEYAEQIMPGEHYDLAFVDTWRDASDGAPMYERMKALEHLSPDTEFLYWIENFLISKIRADRFVEIRRKVERGEYIPYDEIIKHLTVIP